VNKGVLEGARRQYVESKEIIILVLVNRESWSVEEGAMEVM
jgi:hypothetical protein